MELQKRATSAERKTIKEAVAAAAKKRAEEQLYQLFGDFLDNDELSDPNSPQYDQVLDEAVEYFRPDPRRFGKLLMAKPNDEKLAAITILKRMFYDAHEEEEEFTRDPGKFDEAALLMKLCENFVNFSAERFTKMKSSIKAAAPVLFEHESSPRLLDTLHQSGSPGSPLARKETASGFNKEDEAAQRTESLMNTITKVRAELESVSADLLSLCSHVSRLENQTSARLELERKLKFCTNHWAKLGTSQQAAVSEAVLKELECRMEYKMCNNLVKIAKKYLGADSEPLKQFYSDWRRGWEDHKEQLCDAALELTDGAVRVANDALTNFSSTADAASKRRKEPIHPIRNRKNEQEEQAERERKERLEREMVQRLHEEIQPDGRYAHSDWVVATEDPNQNTLVVALRTAVSRPQSVQEKRIKNHRLKDAMSRALQEERRKEEEERVKHLVTQKRSSTSFLQSRPLQGRAFFTTPPDSRALSRGSSDPDILSGFTSLNASMFKNSSFAMASFQKSSRESTPSNNPSRSVVSPKHMAKSMPLTGSRPVSRPGLPPTQPSRLQPRQDLDAVHIDGLGMVPVDESNYPPRVRVSAQPKPQKARGAGEGTMVSHQQDIRLPQALSPRSPQQPSVSPPRSPLGGF